MMDKENYIVKLARDAIVEYVQKGVKISPPEEIPDDLQKKNGVFVSLKKKGKLRGCIGTTDSVQDNTAEEIVSNAISAADNDPRFPSVKPEELPELKISVDILGEKERVNSKEELDPAKYGVIVKKGHRTGLLLPDLEGIDTVEKQLAVAKKKAGLTPDTRVDQIYRFPVHRFRE
ncbi:MAG: AmmeMemoRadiSam system protein A [Halanaerobiales bacterium]